MRLDINLRREIPLCAIIAVFFAVMAFDIAVPKLWAKYLIHLSEKCNETQAYVYSGSYFKYVILCGYPHFHGFVYATASCYRHYICYHLLLAFMRFRYRRKRWSDFRKLLNSRFFDLAYDILYYILGVFSSLFRSMKFGHYKKMLFDFNSSFNLPISNFNLPTSVLFYGCMNVMILYCIRFLYFSFS